MQTEDKKKTGNVALPYIVISAASGALNAQRREADPDALINARWLQVPRAECVADIATRAGAVSEGAAACGQRRGAARERAVRGCVPNIKQKSQQTHSTQTLEKSPYKR